MNEVYLHPDNQMGEFKVSDALSNPERFEKELNKKIIMFGLITAGAFVALNLMLFRYRG